MLRTKEQYREKLFNIRPNIYIGGEKVGRDDHRIGSGINVLDLTFDVAQDQKWKGLATAKSSITGEEFAPPALPTSPALLSSPYSSNSHSPSAGSSSI